ncbi:MAG: hypothetical protein AAF685_10455 [Cyanobacteria bacterium P01_C01_bin.89]
MAFVMALSRTTPYEAASDAFLGRFLTDFRQILFNDIKAAEGERLAILQVLLEEIAKN